MSDERQERARRRAEEVAADAPDRAATFAARLSEVERRREERRAGVHRRRRLVAAVTPAAAATVGALALPSVVPIDQTAGAVVGAVAGVVGLGLRSVAARVAAGRGAQAWDWRAERHRLLGDPSRDVRALDEPDGRGGGARDPRR